MCKIYFAEKISLLFLQLVRRTSAKRKSIGVIILKVLNLLENWKGVTYILNINLHVGSRYIQFVILEDNI